MATFMKKQCRNSDAMDGYEKHQALQSAVPFLPIGRRNGISTGRPSWTIGSRRCVWFPLFQNLEASKHESRERYGFSVRAYKGKMGKHDRIFRPRMKNSINRHKRLPIMRSSSACAKHQLVPVVNMEYHVCMFVWPPRTTDGRLVTSHEALPIEKDHIHRLHALKT